MYTVYKYEHCNLPYIALFDFFNRSSTSETSLEFITRPVERCGKLFPNHGALFIIDNNGKLIFDQIYFSSEVCYVPESPEMFAGHEIKISYKAGGHSQ